MGRREGVVHIEIAKFRQFGHEGRIVLFLALVKAGVLQQQHFTIAELCDSLRGDIADAVMGEGDGSLEVGGEHSGDRLQRVLLVRPILWTTEVGEHHHACAPGHEIPEGRQSPIDAGGVGDDAILDGHIEVETKENPLAGYRRVIEGAEGHDVSGLRRSRMQRRGPKAASRSTQRSFPIATAVSDKRFEKPHSLSYQDRIRTKVPSITLVWSMWKTEEWLSWLKSMETFDTVV